MKEIVERATTLRGEIRTPGDKSISHRAVLLSALAPGVSSITGLSNGEDVRGTLRIIAQLGAEVEVSANGVNVRGPDDGLRAAHEPLDCGNSGTTMRLLCGVLAAAPGVHELIGDASLSQRPMDRVAAPLRSMGLGIDGIGERVLPPLTLRSGSGSLRSIDFEVPVPSAQVKSAILFAALQADAPSRVVERVRTRANTEEMLRASGIAVSSVDDASGRTIWIRPGRPSPMQWRVPGDPSQAAFFVVLGLLAGDAQLEITNLYAGEERCGYLGVLERMGDGLSRRVSDGVLNVDVRSTSLRATTVESHEIPSVDEVPILAIAAAAAEGTTRFVDVGELRIKESDRFAGTIDLVNALGARADGEGNDIIVEGLGSASRFSTVSFAGALDHRMVMSAAVAAAAGNGGTLDGVDTVASSYPDFFRDLASLR